MPADITQHHAQTKIKKEFIKKPRADINQHRHKCRKKIANQGALKNAFQFVVWSFQKKAILSVFPR